MLSKNTIDILMITYNRPQYVEITLPNLLNGVDENCRVWVWHNGSDLETLDIVRSYSSHRRFYQLYHSTKNVKLTDPTNWLWRNSDATYLGKIDDDTVVPNGWTEILRKAHEDVPKFGAIGCWLFQDCDYITKLANKKISNYFGHKILEHSWMQGSGYIMKNKCVLKRGLLKQNESFPKYCIDLAWLGWVHGWYFPLIKAEHLDDPRSPYTLIRSDSDLDKYLPLTAAKNNIKNLESYTELIRNTAYSVQKDRKKPGRFYHLRRCLRKFNFRI